nr:nucleotidyl transferase AbiEii/AbiGii toxin family protein [Trinickia symbiotica]
MLSRSFGFEGDRLARAIAATFARRGTPVPIELPDALTHAFADDEKRQSQWNAFIGDVAFNPGDLAGVIRDIGALLMPHAILASKLGG